MTAVGLILPALFAQTGNAQNGADWPMYNRDLIGSRYSPLKQINTSNVQNLTQAWTYRLMPPGGIENPAALPSCFRRSIRSWSTE